MSTIYGLTDEYINLMNIIEENGGEVTPEIEEELETNEENRNKKFEGYARVLRAWEDEIANGDKEILRIKERQEVLSNSIKSLKNRILPFISLYGNTTKSGSKFIDLGIMGKFSVRKSESVDVDDNICDVLSNILKTQIITSKEDLAEAYNAYTIDGNPITEDDIDKLNIKFVNTLSVNDTLHTDNGLNLYHAVKNYDNTKFEVTADKTAIKNAIKAGDSCHFATIVTKENVNLK